MFDVLYPHFKFDKEVTVLETFAGIGSQRKALDRLAKKAAKVNSNTQLYKQCGNSIVVNVLEKILERMVI